MTDHPVLAYSLEGAARATGLSASHLKRAIAAGRLRAKATSFRDDGRPAKRVILAAELQRYLEQLEEA